MLKTEGGTEKNVNKTVPLGADAHFKTEQNKVKFETIFNFFEKRQV